MASELTIQELKPCPYVNGFSSDNTDVNFMLKKYDAYSDFVLFENGKPSRCFRFSKDPCEYSDGKVKE